ncbi:hypothetical protein RJ639_018281 [Escallonia herrerae]|uniref:Embryonic stem cell-specific 5-hydroxymethylcytosine-binding protein n=1 Tax=Escallonia herrerae TaxID=1293975 RepID=A0AA89AI84_9ASTE|nr:hypothetical protein RJ639_018281 [Escallonia herrerae]
MCGRTRCTIRPDDIPRACHVTGRPLRSVDMDRYRPAYNASPGYNLPVVRRDGGADGQGVVVQCMKWGLIPSFTKKTEKPDHYKMFNARSESIYEKASFRRLVPSSRCLVAAEGRNTLYLHYIDNFFLIGLRVAARMPVILGSNGSTDAWLDGSSDSKFDNLLKAYEEPDLTWYPVTPAIGKPTFDGPECVKEIQLKTDDTKPISSFFSKREIKSEEESDSETRNSRKQQSRTSQPKSLKDEPETQHNTGQQSFEEKCRDDPKPNNSVPTQAGGTDFYIKREYEELSADSKPSANKPRTSPVKKKGKYNDVGDKQPTLLSYFGKG